MPTYIALLKYKQKELAAVFGNPARIAAARESFKKLGVEVKTYVTMDRYDLVLVIEGAAADDDICARVLLNFGEGASTTTLKALTDGEVRKVIGSL